MAEYEICDLCKVQFQNPSAKESHIMGKKHQLALHKDHVEKTKEKCGVYITGLPNLVSKKQISDFILTFGGYTEIFVGEGNKFALVDFSDAKIAQELIKKHKVPFMGRVIFIKPRKRRGAKSEEKEAKEVEIDFEGINTSLRNSDINQQIEKLMTTLQPDQTVQVNEYDSVCRDLLFALQGMFKLCEVYPFGSTITGLNFRYSDVDIYVEVPKKEGVELSFIKKARNVLPKTGLFKQIRAIPKAKTPIVKCVHTRTNLNCDFNFKNMLGVCNSYLIRHYLNLAPELRKVAMIIKYWAAVYELHTPSNKFSNYALIMLLIFYLQQEPYCVESVHQMQLSPHSENIQDGWNGGFMPSSIHHSILSEKTVIEILTGFFKYYSQFDFSLNVICPYLGKIIPKADFLRPEILCDEYLAYKINLVKCLPLLVDTAMCVQDPFEHNHNLTKGVSSRLLEDFKMYCQCAVKIFESCNSNEGPLYKLFTCEPTSEKYKCTDSKCEFRIKFGQFLTYLEAKVSKDIVGAARTDRIKKLWYEMVNEFVINVLAKVLRCELTVKSGKKKSDEDNGIADSVTFKCKLYQNLWDARRSIRRDLTLNSATTNLQKEIDVTNYMCDVLFKNVTRFEPISEMELTLKARNDPMQVEFDIIKVSSDKSCFRSFCSFIAIRIPQWLSTHEREMNDAVNKKS